MYKIFITVGTTEFDSLIKAVDTLFVNQSEYVFTAQISSSANYKPSNIDFFEFSSDIDRYVDEADFIITHAGAGSVYSMLEKGKKVIVVPNLSRIDHHQIELTNYVNKNNLAIACNKLDELPSLIELLKNKELCSYQKEDFFGVEIIRNLLI
ncbi:MAG: beta-1,4-N-acetylglucosaminyltransferase [Psychromonas sp.]|jgi:beta-1,4-N-acetylglucosaminyltransferase|uniref:PssE/Cps14G family polysaccharide biosynthesis glycosyltransferase n=1 Tax=Psychromonas sp. TaxID=1884585 RepID=UPI0039E4E834